MASGFSITISVYARNWIILGSHEHPCCGCALAAAGQTELPIRPEMATLQPHPAGLRRQIGHPCNRSGLSKRLESSSCSFCRMSKVGPSATTRPSLRTMVRAQRSRTMSRSWLAMIIVCSKVSSRWMSCRRALGSRLEVGSSMTKMLGDMDSTEAMATDRFSPPRAGKEDGL